MRCVAGCAWGRRCVQRLYDGGAVRATSVHVYGTVLGNDKPWDEVEVIELEFLGGVSFLS